jgi:hypothetical protein
MRFLLFAAMLLSAQGTDAPLRFEATPAGRQVIARLSAKVADKLPAGPLTPQQGEAVLTLALLADDTRTPGPSMLGKYERTGNELTFTPRFPLSAGATYRASMKVAGITTALVYRVPMPAAKAPPPQKLSLTFHPTATP